MRTAKNAPQRCVPLTLFVVLVLVFSTACNITPSPTISPAEVNVRVGESVGFTANLPVRGSVAAMTTPMPAIEWSVDNISGGNSTVGTVTASGLYKAPDEVPSPNRVIIRARSKVDKSSFVATVVGIQNPIPSVTTISPTSLAMGSFSITVTGKNFVNGAVVLLGSQFLTTKFVSNTRLTATGMVTSAMKGPFKITVQNPDPGSSDSNELALNLDPSSNPNPPSGPNPPPTTPPPPGSQPVTAAVAARFLQQSTWGPTPETIARVQQIGLQAFLNEQASAQTSTYPAPADGDDISVVQKRFFTNALSGQDQLRQRVAFALSQIMVVSAIKVNDPSAFVLWQNMLQKDALGNYLNLLNDVTLSPVMGNYLDMVNNDKPNPQKGTAPNENYAREVLQLFSIGLAELNPDATPQLDGSGNPIPTYSQDTIEGFAHTFTGWTYPTKAGATAKFGNARYFGGPMIAFDSHHDVDTKLLLNGVTLPAGGTAAQDLTAALQNIFNHPNVGPFICSRLIQHLVTSNPSPAYVERVAQVFANNGSGVRGDLKAVVRAILLDQEARRGDDAAQAQASDGHLKEPVLFIMNLLRGTNAASDGASLAQYADDMKQQPFFSPSVFNYYPPDFVLAGTNMLGPEFAIFNTSTTISRSNFVNKLIYSNLSSTTTANISNYVALAGTPSQLVDAIAAVMLHGNISSNMRDAITTTVSSITDNTRRAKAALYLVGSSSQFQVEH